MLLYLIKRFIDHCLKEKLFAVDKKIVIGVSGGADSIALADLLIGSRARFKLEPIIAHYEHGLRGRDSIEDARFVQRFASDRSIECVIEHGDVRSYAREKKMSIETAARELRYDFFERLRARLNFDAIALAHHADDQAETILMRLIRGTGLTGLAAMSARAGRLIRPLLTFRKAELEAHCRARGLQTRLDPTNFEPSATRNKIRLELLPLLEKYNPSIVETLRRTGETAAEDNFFIENYARKIYSSTIDEGSGKIKLSAATVKDLPVAIRRALIRMFLTESLGSLEGLGFIHVEGVRRVIDDDLKGVQLPGHITVKREKHFITIERDG